MRQVFLGKLSKREGRGDSPGSPVARVCALNAGALGSIPGQETRSPHATTKAQHSQINKYELFLKKKKKRRK